jgi:hypothetical protein
MVVAAAALTQRKTRSLLLQEQVLVTQLVAVEHRHTMLPVQMAVIHGS